MAESTPVEPTLVEPVETTPGEPVEQAPLVDASCFVGVWPYRNLPLADPEALRARLRSNGITRACVSPLETVLQRSPQVANQTWGKRLTGDPLFEFVPVANPAQAGADEVFDAWPEARAVRIMPGVHDFRLDAAIDFVATAGERGRTVIVQWRMIDARMDHPDVSHREPSVEEVRTLAASCAETRIVVAGVRVPEITGLLDGTSANVWCEVSTAEAPSVVRRLIKECGVDRLLCGTHAPVHVVEALPAKLVAADLSAAEARALTHDNAVAAGLVA